MSNVTAMLNHTLWPSLAWNSSCFLCVTCCGQWVYICGWICFLGKHAFQMWPHTQGAEEHRSETPITVIRGHVPTCPALSFCCTGWGLPKVHSDLDLHSLCTVFLFCHVVPIRRTHYIVSKSQTTSLTQHTSKLKMQREKPGSYQLTTQCFPALGWKELQQIILQLISIFQR
jgi:hypothetical protein